VGVVAVAVLVLMNGCIAVALLVKAPLLMFLVLVFLYIRLVLVRVLIRLRLLVLSVHRPLLGSTSDRSRLRFSEEKKELRDEKVGFKLLKVAFSGAEMIESTKKELDINDLSVTSCLCRRASLSLSLSLSLLKKAV